jgi:glycogen operon protein
MELLLFDHGEDERPARVITMDPEANRTYHYWHVFVPGATPGQIYALRADGPSDAARACRFDSSKVLLDPYGRAVLTPTGYRRADASKFGAGNFAMAMKSVVVDPSTYDWEGDAPLRHPSSRTIIYEMHVRGFTAHPNSGLSADLLGTYAGVIEKIPYLQHLGITAPSVQLDNGSVGRLGRVSRHG